jgi:hypothetical protein
MAEGDWFLLFDVASLTFRGHGQVIVGQRGGAMRQTPNDKSVYGSASSKGQSATPSTGKSS